MCRKQGFIKWGFIVFRCPNVFNWCKWCQFVIIKNRWRDDVIGRKTGAVKCKKLTKEHINAQWEKFFKRPVGIDGKKSFPGKKQKTMWLMVSLCISFNLTNIMDKSWFCMMLLLIFHWVSPTLTFFYLFWADISDLPYFMSFFFFFFAEKAFLTPLNQFYAPIPPFKEMILLNSKSDGPLETSLQEWS